MGMKKIYHCNICGEIIKNPEESFGVNFSCRDAFTLGGYGCTEGVHICYHCARQLAGHLAGPQIREILGV